MNGTSSSAPVSALSLPVDDPATALRSVTAMAGETPRYAKCCLVARTHSCADCGRLCIAPRAPNKCGVSSKPVTAQANLRQYIHAVRYRQNLWSKASATWCKVFLRYVLCDEARFRLTRLSGPTRPHGVRAAGNPWGTEQCAKQININQYIDARARHEHALLATNFTTCVGLATLTSRSRWWVPLRFPPPKTTRMLQTSQSVCGKSTSQLAIGDFGIDFSNVAISGQNASTDPGYVSMRSLLAKHRNNADHVRA